jgi:hypothetical protein
LASALPFATNLEKVNAITTEVYSWSTLSDKDR